jgi:hypothetical protein
MAWIQVEDSIREHDKIYNLADSLKITNAHAVGLMVCLWTWAATAAPDGDVTNFPPRAIAQAAGWEKGGAKGAKAFYDALLRVNFLERSGDSVLIRNWDCHEGILLDSIKYQKEQTRKRVQRYRDRKSHKSSDTSNVTVTPCNDKCNVTESKCNAFTKPNQTKPNHTLSKPSNNNTPSASTVEGAVPDGGVEKDFGRVCQAFEATVNPMPSSKDGEILSQLYRDYPVQRILNAIDEAARCKGRSASYVRSVLQNADHEQKERPPASGPDLTDPNRYKNFGK